MHGKNLEIAKIIQFLFSFLELFHNKHNREWGEILKAIFKSYMSVEMIVTLILFLIYGLF